MFPRAGRPEYDIPGVLLYKTYTIIIRFQLRVRPAERSTLSFASSAIFRAYILHITLSCHVQRKKTGCSYACAL